MSTIIKNKKELIEKLKKVAASKAPFDAEAGMPSDPNEAGKATPPAGSEIKTTLPESKTNKDGEHDKQMADNLIGKPEEISKPKVNDGNSEDERGTSELKSLAKSASDIVSALRGNKKENNIVNFENNKKASGKNNDDIAVDFAEGFTPEFHLKIASIILSTEEGRVFADELVKREKGAQAAAMIMKAAAEQEKLDEYQNELTKQAYEQQLQLEEIQNEFASLAPEEQKKIVKLAYAQQINENSFTSDIEKQAYAVGEADAAAMLDAESGETPMGITGDDVTIEDILMVLEQLVQSGQLQPEDAQAIMEAFISDSGGVDAIAEQQGLEEVPEDVPEDVAQVEAEMGKVASVVDTLVK